MRAWVGQPKLDAVLRPKLAGGDELGAEPQDALGEEVTHMLRVALDNEVRRYKMSARKLTV